MNEIQVMTLRPSWLNYIGNFIIAFTVVACFFWFDKGDMGCLVGILIAIFPILSRYSNMYVITTNRVVEHRGIVARRSAEADLEEIVLFNVYQSILGRIFGVGRIEMMSASDGGPDVVFSGICQPFQIKEIIWKLKQQQKL